MDFFDMIDRRESCRAYTDTPVERDKLLRCLEAARLSPSACNSQPWSFTAVLERALALQVAPLLKGPGGMNGFAVDCPCFVIVTEEKENLSARFGMKAKEQDFTSLDIGIASAQFCLAATAQGLSTCMVGWFDEAKLKALLSLPEKKRVRLVICLGYAKTGAARPKKRKTMEEIARIL